MSIRKAAYSAALIFCTATFLTLTRCDLPHQPGPMPSTIVAADFQPGMNILGVLRLTDDTTGSSFIYIEKALSPEDYDQYTDTLPIVTDAHPRIWSSSDPATLFHFTYHGKDSDHKYVDSTFQPIAGVTYNLEIDAPGLPQLRASTTVPHRPIIDTNSIVMNTDGVNFALATSPDAYLYEVYIIGDYGQTSQRFKPNSDRKMTIALPFPPQLGPMREIHVYAYDNHLASIMGATSTILPQAFLPTISMVTGGYGGFGSLALTRVRCR